MNDEELIRLRKKIHAGQSLSRQETWKALDAITTLCTQLAEARSELSYTNKRLEHAFERIERQARTIDDLTVRINRAEAALAAQIEVDSDVAEAERKIWDRGYNTTSAGFYVCRSLANVRDAIRAQPHDRSALDRMLAEAEKRGYEIAKAEDD